MEEQKPKTEKQTQNQKMHRGRKQLCKEIIPERKQRRLNKQ
jgi:hypothetical protein